MENRTDMEYAILRELAKAGREMLYDMNHKDYKNSAVKTKVWSDVSNVSGLSKKDCQKLWKNLKSKRRVALRNRRLSYKNPSIIIKPYTEWLLKETEFLTNFVTETETESDVIAKNYDPSSTQQDLSNEMSEGMNYINNDDYEQKPQISLLHQLPIQSKLSKQNPSSALNTAATTISKREKLERYLVSDTEKICKNRSGNLVKPHNILPKKSCNLDAFALLVKNELCLLSNQVATRVKMDILRLIFKAGHNLSR